MRINVNNIIENEDDDVKDKRGEGEKKWKNNKYSSKYKPILI